MKRSTIQDVADLAGVSRAAVSKVLRNAYGLSDEMRQKVEAAMAALNYRPQMAARGLRGRTYSLGVLLPDMRNPFFPDILDGIFSALKTTQYQPVLGVRPAMDATEEQIVNMLLDRKIDGFVMIAPRLDDAFLKQVTASVPTVMIGQHNRNQGYDTINNDDEKGAQLVVEHLHGLGHRSIAYVGLDMDDVGLTNSTSLREKGYIAAMTERGLADEIRIVRSSHFLGPDYDYQIARELLSSDDRPSALFVWTDSVAFKIMAVAHNLGIRIPEDLSIVGYDNIQQASLPQLSLTSIDQSGRLLGEKSAQMLIERIDGRSREEHFIVPPRLDVKRSSGVFRADKAILR
jgi:DNA-binding LacI/PurR family transcriptional regulator